MPASGRDLNPRQERFIEHYVATGNATQSAIRAGYSEKAAHARGHELKNRYSVEIEKKTRETIRSLVPGALAQLKSLALAGESEAVRFQATRDILDRAGFKPKDVVETVTVEKSTDELRAELEQLRAGEGAEVEAEEIPKQLN
jgi:phage terminase small subunit